MFIRRIGCSVILCLAILAAESVRAQRLLGTDVSGYQPSVNWTKVKNAGVVFAWAKATEGTGYVNPYFTNQVNGAKGVGIYIGAYHFARPSLHPNVTGLNSADSEAAYFWSKAGGYIKNGGSYSMPMLDWEDPKVTNQLSQATMSAWVNEWCSAVSNYAYSAGITIHPVVYTGSWYSRPSSTYVGLNSTVTKWHNWMSYYPYGNSSSGYGTPHPLTDTGPTGNALYPWSSWNIWQYGDTNWSGGDADVFNGDLSAFIHTFVIGGDNAPDFVSGPNNVVVAAGSSATFSAQVSGLAPLTYRWFFNGTIIPDATASDYTIADAQSANAGSYTLTVSNAYATITNTVYLTVLSDTGGSILAPSGMVNWWPGEKTPVDIFGPLTATPYGGTTYTTGKVGEAFHFNGSSGYLSPDNATELSGNWTVCLWVYRQNTSGTSASFIGDNTYAFKLEQYGTPRLIGFTKSLVADYYFTNPVVTLPANTWTHLAITYNGSTIRLYTNGVLASSQIAAGGAVTTPPSGLPLPRAAIGCDLLAGSGNPIDYMLGRLDEIQTFNRALTAGEIQSIYNAGGNGLIRVPQFAGVISPNPGQIQISLRGQTGKTFTLYTSTNLTTWTSMKIQNPTGVANFMDSTTSSPQRFYRLTQP